VAIVTIDAVEIEPAAEALLGCWLDAPTAGDVVETYSFNVSGWALGRDTRLASIEVLDGERVVASVPPNRHRPDIVESFASAEGVESCGFEVLVRALELEPAFTVEIVVVLEDGTRLRLASVSGRRERMGVPRSAGLNPVMLTTIGRSGSKWLAWLLSCHPAVVAFQPLVFEPRVATYWGTVFRSLTAPRSYLRQIHTERWGEPRWWLGDGTAGLPAAVELGMADWLGDEAVAELAAVCQERTEAFYREVARRSGKSDVRYFAEKFLLEPVLLDITRECFAGAREVILVRDFRDRLSSVFAWNEKRGDRGFGHEESMSQAQYLAERVRVDAYALLDRWQRRGETAHLVRYEDLVLDPSRTLTGLFEYLGVEAGTGTVEAVLELAGRPSELLDTHRTVNDPAHTIGRWQRDLPAELAEQCNEMLAPVLAAFGYSTDAAPVERAG
jgi:Sulfotransferase family